MKIVTPPQAEKDQQIKLDRRPRGRRAELNNRFDYHPPKSTAIADTHAAVRAKVKTLALWIDRNTPEGREQALAITKLEEALFWANAAIARQSDVG